MSQQSKVTPERLRSLIVEITLHSTILIEKIDELEGTPEQKIWLQKLKQTGKRFREELISYTTRQKSLYNDDTCSHLYQSLSILDKFGRDLSILGMDEFSTSQTPSKKTS